MESPAISPPTPAITVGTTVIRKGDKYRRAGRILSVQVMGWPGGKYGPLPAPLVTVRWDGKAARGAYLASIGFGGSIGQTTTVKADRLETEDGQPLFVRPKPVKSTRVYELYDVLMADGRLYTTFLNNLAGAETVATTIGGTVKHRRSSKLPNGYSC